MKLITHVLKVMFCFIAKFTTNFKYTFCNLNKGKFRYLLYSVLSRMNTSRNDLL